MGNRKPSDSIRLVGFDSTGRVVHEQLISRRHYYEELHPVIDSDEFRSERRLVRLVGTTFGESGEVEEEWENSYSDAGSISGSVLRDSRGRVVSDGAMTELTQANQSVEAASATPRRRP